MSDTWIDFKRSFGGYARRDQKATTLVDEIQVQQTVLTNLGRPVDAVAMGADHVLATAALNLAQQTGDTTQGYRDLGAVKTQARTVMRSRVDLDAVAGMLRAVPELLDRIEHHLDQRDGGRKPKLDARLQDLRNRLGNLNNGSAKSDVAALEKAAIRLLDDTLKDTYGGDKYLKDDIPDERSAAFIGMLQQRYGITAETPIKPGLEKFYEALSLLPESHIRHTSLTSVKIEETDTSAGDYSKTAKRISIDAATARTHPTMAYEVDGKKKKLDTFTAATLHEVGHSVDDRASVMANPAGVSFGGWNVAETLDTVADACWADIENNVGQAHKNAMLPEIKKALQNQGTAQPPTVPLQAWQAAQAALTLCMAIATDDRPWKIMRVFGNRCYAKDQGSLLSYSKAQRDALTVRDYQWRAPAEWFAELYTASWMFQKKPAAAVDQTAAIYMFRGK